MLACWFGVDRSTITRAIGEVRPLLAQRAARSRRASCCALSPRSSSTWAPAVRPGSSTAQRSASGAQPQAARTGTSSCPEDQAKRREGDGPHGLRGTGAVLQPCPAGQ
ncbi:transposase family protein [Streptomyces sp. MS1.AVA.1]|uniref:Transposase family protein n=1 Tax=Streptomyces machairae TaxID=3134109 RepID=A0ABU8UF25_9ACTN